MDDLLIFGVNMNMIIDTKELLNLKFKMKLSLAISLCFNILATMSGACKNIYARKLRHNILRHEYVI